MWQTKTREKIRETVLYGHVIWETSMWIYIWCNYSMKHGPGAQDSLHDAFLVSTYPSALRVTDARKKLNLDPRDPIEYKDVILPV